MNVIRRHKHEVFTETVNEVAFSADDDKRIIFPDRMNTHAWGHGSICTKNRTKGNTGVTYYFPVTHRT